MSYTRPCTQCGTPFQARNTRNRFCSRTCAGTYQFRDQPKARRTWSNHTPVDSDHRKLRAAMLPEAIGTPCPLRISPKCTGIMTEPRLMQLDHILERSRGGRSTRDNCRIVCAACNHRRGAMLGGNVTSRRHGRQRRQAYQIDTPDRQLPKW